MAVSQEAQCYGQPSSEFRPRRLQAPSPPVTEFTVLPRSKADVQLNPSELVLGVSLGDESRAYPLDMISRPDREILNDVLGQTPIAVTWCRKCFSGCVFERRIAGRDFTFGVAGMLWHDNLVMYDTQTKSLWSQMLGEAMRGEMRSTRLELRHSVITDWTSWKDRFPKTTVVSFPKTKLRHRTSMLKKSKYFLLGYTHEGIARAWTFDDLATRNVINDDWRGQKLLAVMDRDSGTVRLFSRQLGSQTMTFQHVDGKLKDRETATVWDPITGKALSGPGEGRHLRVLPAYMSIRQKWKLLYPGCEYYAP